HVFIDWDLVEPGYGVAWRAERPTSWEMPYGVRLAVHPPRIEAEPVVQSDRPYEGLISSYCTWFEDEGRYRLYYECYDIPSRGEANDLQAMLAYADSTDGVHWEKPNLGLIELHGSTANNLVYGLDLSLGRGAHGSTVFKDPNAPADERYKLV